MWTEQQLNALDKSALVLQVLDWQTKVAALEAVVAELKARVDMNANNSS